MGYWRRLDGRAHDADQQHQERGTLPIQQIHQHLQMPGRQSKNPWNSELTTRSKLRHEQRDELDQYFWTSRLR